MSRRVHQRAQVELFPFLAVLVCVMGSLIFLLLVTTKRMRAAAVERALSAMETITDGAPFALVDSESALLRLGRADQLPRRIEPVTAAVPVVATPAVNVDAERAAEALRQPWSERLAALTTRRETLEAEQNKQRLLQLATERQIAELRQKLLDEEAELARLMGQLAVATTRTPEVDAERARLEQAILSLRQQLKQLETQQREGSSKFAIVPYDGKSGTTRRPIVIECSADQLRFLPEDITLRPTDINGFTPRFNPLLAGAVALSRYWVEHEVITDSGKPSAPYVLLVVRPNGTLAYYIAMNLLSSMQQPYGYELLPDDIQIDLGPADPSAKAACETAIAHALNERERMIETLRPGGGSAIGRDDSGISGFSDGPGGVPRPRAGGATGSPAPGPRNGGSGSSGSGSGGGAGAGSRQQFQLSDLQDEPSVGDRSWEDVERFEGQEHRRRGSDANGGRPAAESSEIAPLVPELPPSSARPTASPTVGGNAESDASWRPAGSPRSNVSPDQENAGSAQRFTELDPAAPSLDRSNATNAPPELPSPDSHVDLTRPASRNKSRRRADQLPFEQLQRRKWGSYDPGASIGVERSITIDIDAERMVIGESLAIALPPGATRDDVFTDMLIGVDHLAKTWGKPGNGFYWIPSLKFRVAPGGNAVYERISPLVNKCGLSHSREDTLEKPAARRAGSLP